MEMKGGLVRDDPPSERKLSGQHGRTAYRLLAVAGLSPTEEDQRKIGSEELGPEAAVFYGPHRV
jgi:hypothetical protein